MRRLPHLQRSLLLAATLVAARAGGEVGQPPRLVNDLCPVMTDEPASPQYEVQFRGAAVRFCCSDCRETFTEDPSQYVSRLPQLPAATIQPATFDSQHASAEWAAGWLDRWTRPVSLVLASLIAGLLVVRIARRKRLSHANGGTRSHMHADEALHPATGPRLHD